MRDSRTVCASAAHKAASSATPRVSGQHLEQHPIARGQLRLVAKQAHDGQSRPPTRAAGRWPAAPPRPDRRRRSCPDAAATPIGPSPGVNSLKRGAPRPHRREHAILSSPIAHEQREVLGADQVHHRLVDRLDHVAKIETAVQPLDLHEQIRQQVGLAAGVRPAGRSASTTCSRISANRRSKR